MTVDFQASLFEGAAVGAWARSPVGCNAPSSPAGHGSTCCPAGSRAPTPSSRTSSRRAVARRAASDVRQVVDVPRLLHTYGVGEELPHPALTEAREALTAHYLPELGEPFVTAGCCYYRDGHDSVAWHGDNIGRGRPQDTMVAIVSFGSPRKLQLRPVGGHVEVSHALGHGDLIVMGGSCQRTWEHAVPKTARPVGPRISVQFRPRNVF